MARPSALSALAAALVMIAVGALTSTAAWVGFFEHELRTERLGGVVAETTVQGAQLWRLMLVVGGAVGAAIVFGLAWLAGQGHGPATSPDATLEEAPAPHAGSFRPGAESAVPTTSAVPARAVRQLAGVVFLLALALIVRLPRLAESFWYDEISALLDFAQFGAGAVMGNYFAQSNHILHGVLCAVTMEVAGGVNEPILRLPALLFSLLAVPAMLFLGREASPSESPSVTAWAAAALAATAPVAVLEGVEARGYSMMIFFAALSTALFLRARRQSNAGDPQALATWLLYALAASLGAWSHLVTVCVPLGHGVVAACDLCRAGRRRQALAAMLALLLAATLTIVLYSPALPDVLAIRSEFRVVEGNEPTLLGPEGWHALLQLGGAWIWWAALPGLLLAALGVVAAMRSRSLSTALAAALAGAVVAVVLAAVGDSWLYARFLLISMPGALLLMGAGLGWLWARARWAASAAAVVTMAAWAGDLATRPPKQPLRDAVAEVVEARLPNERVAVVGLVDNVIAYYGALAGIEIEPSGPLGRDLDRLLERATPEWMIVMYPRSVPERQFQLLDQAGYVLKSEHRGWVDWDNGDVLVYRRR